MESSADRNASDILTTMTCQDLLILMRSLNATDYESSNMTREVYTNLLHGPHCKITPYPGTKGFKKWIVTGVILFFLTFGLIGNLLSGTIMFRRARRGHCSYFYLTLLAIVDICVLYTGCLLFLFEIAFNYHLITKSPVHCRLVIYIDHLFTYISAWLVVIVTFERFMVVRFPLQSIHFSRMRVAHYITSATVLFFVIFTAHCFFTMDVFRYALQTEEGYDPDFQVCDLTEHRRLFAILDVCFYSVIPSILILIFNILIISTMLYAIRQRRGYLQASSCVPTMETYPRNNNNKTKSTTSIRAPFFRSRSAESSPMGRSCINSVNKQRVYYNPINQTSRLNFVGEKRIQRQPEAPLDSTSATGIRLTFLLLMISFIFVLCTLPISIRSLIAVFIPEHNKTIRWEITQLCLTLLMYFNHTINFVLYCLTGRAFRSECRKILCGLWALKDFHISCASSPESNKNPHYQNHVILVDRTRFIIPSSPNGQPQQQQQQQRFSPTVKGFHL